MNTFCFNQIFANVVTDDVIAVTRHCPSSHKSVFLVAHTSFYPPHEGAIPTDSNQHPNRGFIPSMSVPGELNSHDQDHVMWCWDRMIRIM